MAGPGVRHPAPSPLHVAAPKNLQRQGIIMSEPTVAVHRRWRMPLLLLALLTLSTAPAYAQQRITGQVTAAGSGQPLVAVQVQAVGTTVGTATNAEGRYTITVPATATTLAFSRIGFARREIPIAGQTTVNVAPSTVATKLEEVVVVGYG